MTVVCPHCSLSTTDLEFCDHCNREIQRSAPTAKCSRTSLELADGELIDLSDWKGVWPRDPADYAKTANHRRVYGFSPASWSSCRDSVLKRQAIRFDSLPQIDVVEFEEGAVVVSRAINPAAIGVSKYREKACDLPSLEELLRQCEQISKAMTHLHEAGFVWLNFQKDAFDWTETGLVITNMDCRLFSIGECPTSMQISSQWSAPETEAFDARVISAATDVFHLGLYVYYSIAGLLECGFSGAGLAAFGFALPHLRVYSESLPPGLAPVIERAVHRRPSLRFTKPAEFIEALRVAVDGVRGRTLCAQVEVPKAKKSMSKALLDVCASVFTRDKREELKEIEVGCVSVAGTAKQSADIPNQDIAEVRDHEFQGQSLHVVVVADGVSTATVGSGDVASKIACRAIHEFVAKSLHDCRTYPDWGVILRDACRLASGQVVGAAKELGDFPAELTDSGIMSSTAVIAVIYGDNVVIANVGDSRAYLVREAFAEQLTVDGDTGTRLLSQMTPPEDVLALGESGKSLHFCLGSCHINTIGELLLNVDRCTPTIYQLRLMDGDTLILCTDGLVDEGVFLEPEELRQLVHDNKALNAQELSEKLVAEADSRQRSVSDVEPKGFGDNISCALIRFATVKY